MHRHHRGRRKILPDIDTFTDTIVAGTVAVAAVIDIAVVTIASSQTGSEYHLRPLWRRNNSAIGTALASRSSH